MLGESHTFSASFLNELRLGFSRYTTQRTVQDDGFDAGTIFTTPDGAPLPGVPRNSGLPSVTIGGGFAALGRPTVGQLSVGVIAGLRRPTVGQLTVGRPRSGPSRERGRRG